MMARHSRLPLYCAFALLLLTGGALLRMGHTLVASAQTPTPAAVGTYANPRTSATCAIDPNNNVPETSDANNACSNSVAVTAPDTAVDRLTACESLFAAADAALYRAKETGRARVVAA